MALPHRAQVSILKLFHWPSCGVCACACLLRVSIGAHVADALSSLSVALVASFRPGARGRANFLLCPALARSAGEPVRAAVQFDLAAGKPGEHHPLRDHQRFGEETRRSLAASAHDFCAQITLTCSRYNETGTASALSLFLCTRLGRCVRGSLTRLTVCWLADARRRLL
jgi:hypothetical protein